MARDKRPKIKVRASVALVGDGETERIYFADVRQTDRPKNLTIAPDFPRKLGSYIGVLDRAMELSKDHSRVYALIDMDKIIQDHQQIAYKLHKEKAEKQGVIILENNPCFEIWILLHFVDTGKNFTNCDQVSDEIKRKNYIKGYDKSEKFQTAARLYATHKEKLKTSAIPNAAKLEINRNEKGEFFPRAETFKFFEWYFQELKDNSQ